MKLDATHGIQIIIEHRVPRLGAKKPHYLITVEQHDDGDVSQETRETREATDVFVKSLFKKIGMEVEL